MLMDEKCAAETWCPHARVARIEAHPVGPAPDVIIAGVNRDALGSQRGFVIHSCRCIASRCSQWRWRDPVQEVRASNLDNFERPDGDGWIQQAFERTNPERRGYCGLAGPPGAGEE